MINLGRWLTAKGGKRGDVREDAECLVKRTLRGEEGSRRLRRSGGKKPGTNRKGGENQDEEIERKRQRKDGAVGAGRQVLEAEEGSTEPGESSTSSPANETVIDSRVVRDGAEKPSSSSSAPQKEQQPSENQETEARKQLTAVGGSLTMTHRVDARGESFRIH